MSATLDSINGSWKMIDYPPHPECVGCIFEISHESPNKYHFSTRVINGIGCILEYDPENNECKTCSIRSTEMGGPPEKMKKESFIMDFLSHINFVVAEDEQHLTVKTTNGDAAHFERE
ncbi:unnamed protein product [Rotaria sp. Silwood1]|nr:unnamed protein product [Rotaria sp. Silwood1]CAF3956333.1 unnamed protein product [Rotaria sp. Silwood1]CAF4884556.1 unnamed protein product [Rotaria sp. Silwood1]CAF4971290.1 unnamed protein product [Rotaria sp. Silwood1]